MKRDFRSVNQAICEVLGLDPTDIRNIKIELSPNALPLVTVEYVDIIDDRLVETLTFYSLTPRPTA